MNQSENDLDIFTYMDDKTPLKPSQVLSAYLFEGILYVLFYTILGSKVAGVIRLTDDVGNLSLVFDHWQ